MGGRAAPDFDSRLATVTQYDAHLIAQVFYFRFGTFMVVSMSLAWGLCVFLLVPLLAACGPTTTSATTATTAATAAATGAAAADERRLSSSRAATATTAAMDGGGRRGSGARTGTAASGYAKVGLGGE